MAGARTHRSPALRGPAPRLAVLVPCSSLVDWFRLGPAAWHL
jgi:hypothetical protein